MPVPLSSWAQAWSAFTCFVERSRLAWTLRSSQIFSIFAPAAVEGFVASAKKSAAWVLSALRTTPSIEVRVFPFSAPLGVAGAERALLRSYV